MRAWVRREREGICWCVLALLTASAVVLGQVPRKDSDEVAGAPRAQYLGPKNKPPTANATPGWTPSPTEPRLGPVPMYEPQPEPWKQHLATPRVVSDRLLGMQRRQDYVDARVERQTVSMERKLESLETKLDTCIGLLRQGESGMSTANARLPVRYRPTAPKRVGARR